MTLVDRCLRRYYKWSSERFSRRPINIRCDRPVISFSFDDFPQTALSEGGRVLGELRIRATYFAALGLAGQATSVGRVCTLDDVRKVIGDGHELGCHTFGHELSHRVGSRAYERSIQRNRERLGELELNCPWRVFAYPAGSATPATKRIIQKRFLCGRGISPGINAGCTDLNLLRANSLYSDARPIGHHVALIQRAVAENGWLIFYTHDVQDNPSRYGCTADYLRKVAEAAIDCGAEILPIGDAIDAIQRPETTSGDARVNEQAAD